MKKQYVIALLYGWITILLFVLFTSAMMAGIVRFTTITTNTFSYVTLAVGVLSLFLGGLITGIKGKEKGLFLGLITGLGFSLLIFLIQFLGFHSLFTFGQILFHLTYIISAMVGGIVGVNVSSGPGTGAEDAKRS